MRSFHRVCSAGGLRPVAVRHLRHTTATLLKNLGVPARDAQIILGHSRLALTLEIYTVRAEMPSASCDVRVFVDDAADQIASPGLERVEVRDGLGQRLEWGSLP